MTLLGLRMRFEELMLFDAVLLVEITQKKSEDQHADQADRDDFNFKMNVN